ncbi:MAG: HNH endonuclease [Candidatus Rokuibacteriota bacterium]
MVVDHIVPKRLGGKSYRHDNSAAACWSCNLLKSGLPVNAFKRELESLAHAVVEKARNRSR